jgi:ABC-type ATPase involved in cell division
VFQDHQLLMDRPVYDNVALPLMVADTPLRDIDKRVRAALDQVGLLEQERALPSELSVGEQQRVGIARAVVGKPAVLIADEPTGNLDHASALDVMRLFRRFCSGQSAAPMTCPLAPQSRQSLDISPSSVKTRTGSLLLTREMQKSL